MASNEIYYYSKLYEDTFDATGWKIILNETQPIPAYATMIYFTILTESTAAKGHLLRDENHAYTRDQLMALCHIRRNDPDEIKDAWNRAFDILIEEGIIEVSETGGIHVVLSEELFGSESQEARKKRNYRQRRLDLFEEEINRSAGQTEDNEGTNGGQCPATSGQEGDNVGTIKTPLKENESISNPLKNKEQREKTSTGQCPADETAREFVEIYPKKTDVAKILPLIQGLSEIECEALLVAARRIASDPSKTEANGRFAMDPVKFIKSRPWTEDDLKDAESILWGRRQSEALAEGEEQ